MAKTHYIGFILLCLIIAIPCWIVGSFKELRKRSPLFTEEIGTVINFGTSETTSCSAHGACHTAKNYICSFRLNNTSTCNLMCDSNCKNYCIINNTRHLYKFSTYTHRVAGLGNGIRCTLADNYYEYMGRTGFAFFILAGCFIILPCIFCICKDIHDKNKLPTIELTQYKTIV